MKRFHCFIFQILVCYSRATFGSENIGIKDIGFENNHDRDKNRGNLSDILRNKRFDYAISNNEGQEIYGERDVNFMFDQGNPDIYGIIERPCQAYSYDTFCIRKFLAEHSHCKISGRRLPDPFRRAQTTFNFPSANMTINNIETSYEGLNNARVVEFYINKVTDNLVIAFSFDSISVASNNANVKFYRRGREPEVHNDFIGAVYMQLTITLIIPGLNNLRLDRAEIYTYAENPNLPFVLGPRVGQSSDPEVVRMYQFYITAGVPVEHVEGLNTEGVFYGTNYLQYQFCDFGLKAL